MTDHKANTEAPRVATWRLLVTRRPVGVRLLLARDAEPKAPPPPESASLPSAVVAVAAAFSLASSLFRLSVFTGTCLPPMVTTDVLTETRSSSSSLFCWPLWDAPVTVPGAAPPTALPAIHWSSPPGRIHTWGVPGSSKTRLPPKDVVAVVAVAVVVCVGWTVTVAGLGESLMTVGGRDPGGGGWGGGGEGRAARVARRQECGK
eukprot:jgi/Mesvir1/4414/Mv11912-RA.1